MMSAEEFQACQNGDGRRRDQATAHGQAMFRRLNIAAQSGDVRLGRDALAQGVFHRIGMGARLIVVDSGAGKPINVPQAVEQGRRVGGGHDRNHNPVCTIGQDR